MVLQKRLYYGFDGSQAPPIPRGTRSLRSRGPLRKKSADNKMCAFDLLASVADKILLEQQSPSTASSDEICHKGSTPGIVKEERRLNDRKLVDFHNESKPEIGLDVVEIPNNKGGFSSGSASAITNSGCTDKTGFDEKKPLNDRGKEPFQSHIGEASFGFGSDTCSSEDPEFLDRNLSKSDNYVYNTDVKVHRDHYTCGFPSPCRNNVNLLSKDDDDNSFECTKRSTFMKTIVDRRIKKLVVPRCSRAPPKMNGRNLSDSGVEMHTIYQIRKRVSKCQRSQRMYPFKKRKLLHTTSDDTTRCDCEDVYDPLEKATDISASDFETSKLSEADGQSALFTPRDSNVKLRIKSFRVPELFIELPETATVGSLKKTVMDAIKTLLGNGLHIGVLVQGRKIKDDNTTLLQSGISHDTLGFTLEPTPSRIHKTMCSEEEPFIGLPPQSFSSSSKEKGVGDSKALVEVPESNVQALTLFAPPPLPLEKSKRSENAQRRMRRPFSVSEVEALVQAVEELGTGRWRDVKTRAFDNINRRTYVDLKDKWKTLVHTARISPQQRRGEPVPQELLDRVLAAHSYWSHHRAKHQPDTRLLV